MVKANELRIGNLVYDSENEIKTIDFLTTNGIGFIGGVKVIEVAYPIPLTEEWLLKFGFEKEYPSYFSKDNVELIFTNEGCLFLSKRRSNYNHVYQYVHQLQNLCFALTGEELTIKETVNQ